MYHKNKGTGLFVVLIMLSAMAMVIVSALSLVNTETRLNKRAQLHFEARQAVESLIQYGVAEVHLRNERGYSMQADEFLPLNRPLTIGSDFKEIYNDPDNKSNIVVGDAELIAGEITDSEHVTIYGDQMGNERDEQRGRKLFKKTVELLGKATVSNPYLGSPITVYASQYLEIREIPLFTYAIFYNLPMEIAPGIHSGMSIHGDVHVNGDLFVNPASNGGWVDFHGMVSASGGIFHGSRYGGANNGSVNFTDGYQLVAMKQAGTWIDSNAANFATQAEQLWDGNVRTGVHGVGDVELAGIGKYVEKDDPTTPEVEERLNNAYTIIEPVVNKILLPDKAAFTGTDAEFEEALDKAKAKQRAERNKFSYMAGLTVEVVLNDDGTFTELNYYAYERDPYGNIMYDNTGKPKRVELTLPEANAIAELKPFVQESNGTITSGLYDKRQGQNMNIIELDIEKLKDNVHANDQNNWGGQNKQKPKNWWNGIVYVKFPQEHETSQRADNVNPAKFKNWGIKLVNGKVIPNPSFAHEDNVYGTSIATNAPMYVQGDYNADITNDSNSPTSPDFPHTFNQQGHEAPAALVADAISFLSNAWQDVNSNKAYTERQAIDTEISAAILTGIIPTKKGGVYSGGVQNLPRFLEDWMVNSNMTDFKKFIVRGSMVTLFESEVANVHQHGINLNGDKVRRRPSRIWGFHEKYNETPPPGPTFTAYRGRDLRLISKEEYDTRVAGYLANQSNP